MAWGTIGNFPRFEDRSTMARPRRSARGPSAGDSARSASGVKRTAPFGKAEGRGTKVIRPNRPSRRDVHFFGSHCPAWYATRRIGRIEALLGFRELGVELEPERERPGPQMRHGARQRPRGDLHHAIRERNPVRVAQVHAKARAGAQDYEFAKREAFAAVTVRMARRPRGRAGVQEGWVQRLLRHGGGGPPHRGGRGKPQGPVRQGPALSRRPGKTCPRAPGTRRLWKV